MKKELEFLREEMMLYCPTPYREQDVIDFIEEYFQDDEPDAKLVFTEIFERETWYRDVIQGAIEIMCENGDECGWRDSIRDAIGDLMEGQLGNDGDYKIVWK